MKELRELTEEIDSYSAQQQVQIAQTLSQQLLDEEDPRMRRELTRALGYTPTQESISALLSALSDSNVNVRVAACESLALQNNSSTIPALARALGAG